MPFSSEGREPAGKYDIAYTVLIGLLFIVILPFAILSLVKCKHGRDPAREFVHWLKAAMVLFTTTMGMIFVVGILSTYEIHSDSSHWHITHAIYHVGYLGEFFRTLSAAAVMVMLVVLGLGIHCANEGVTHALAKVLRYATYFVAFVVTALTIAYYGLWVHFQVNYTNSTGYAYRHVSAWELLKTINYLTGTTAILLWIASLVIMGLAIFIFMKNSRSPLKSASTFYLVASFLNLLSMTWTFTFAVKWLLQDGPQESHYYILILTIILGWWSRGALLVLTFLIAAKNGSRGGIWSNHGKIANGSKV